MKHVQNAKKSNTPQIKIGRGGLIFNSFFVFISILIFVWFVLIFLDSFTCAMYLFKDVIIGFFF